MKDKGFSLIELIIVIGVMAILVAIVAPNLTRYLHSSKKETDARNLDEVEHQVFNCISEAATKDIDIIVGSTGTMFANYELEYDSSTGKSVVTAKSNGDSNFAVLLTEILEEATTASSMDKNKKKIGIKISKRLAGGYDVKTGYIS
jgi:prepilin-type N-terminal cleavage/methylation domain-containing protein